MKIKSIRIEGLHNVVNKEYEFDNINYIHGPNGAGKSTIMQAIQLALLGYIPGTDKTKSAIFKHSNNHTLAVTLNLDDNGELVTIQRVWTGNSSNVTSSVKILPENYDISTVISEIELPVFNFNEFIGMTSNKLKDWFINFLPDSKIDVDWNVVLSNNVPDTCPTTLKDELVVAACADITKFGLSGMDEIRRTNQYFKDKLSAIKLEATRIQNTIQSLIYYDDVDTDMSEEQVATQISKYTEDRNKLVEYQYVLKQNETAISELCSYSDLAATVEEDPNYVKYTEIVDTANQQLPDIESEIDKLKTEQFSIQTTLSEYDRVIGSGGVCPYTSSECDKMVSDIGRITTEKVALSDELAELTANINSLYAKRDALRESRKDSELAIAKLSNRYTMRDAAERRMTVLPECPSESKDVDYYNTKISELTDLQVKLRSNKQYQDMIESLTESKFELDATIEVYKNWDKLTGVNGLQSSATSPFTDFEHDMDKYVSILFGNDTHAVFDIQAKANSFSFGICRNNSYIPFNMLSSGEKCLYTLAMLFCIVALSKSPLKLVLVDDLIDHLDDENANNLFASLSKIDDIQIVLAGVKHISDTISCYTDIVIE